MAVAVCKGKRVFNNCIFLSSLHAVFLDAFFNTHTHTHTLVTKQDLKTKAKDAKKKRPAFRPCKSLSISAATQAIRRLCTPSIKTGKRKVSNELAEKFLGCGSGRRELVKLWMTCNGDVEAFFVF